MASISLCFYDENDIEIRSCDASVLSFSEETVILKAREMYGDAELCEKRVTMVEQMLLSEAILLLSDAKRFDELPQHLREAIEWPFSATTVCIIIQ